MTRNWLIGCLLLALAWGALGCGKEEASGPTPGTGAPPPEPGKKYVAPRTRTDK